MKTASTFHRSGFRSQDRVMGMVGAWTAFIVNEAYAVTSGLAFLSVNSSSDPISDPYLSIMSALVVLMAPFLVITMVAVHAYAAPEHKPYSLAALAFMILLTGITSVVNFALFSVARQPTPASSMWAASFIPSEWPPLPQALDFFAWDWFFALSMLLAAPVFRGSRLENAVRALMVFTAILCFLGLVWLPVSPAQANTIGIIGWGVIGPIVFLLLANLFTRIQPEPDLPQAA
jgi:hypothetical protein